MLESSIVAAQVTAGAKLSANPADQDNQDKAAKAAWEANRLLLTLETLDEYSVDGSELPLETLTLTT